MKIILRKINQSNHYLTIIKNGEVFDEVQLDTKTYFLHDIVHYCVEKELKRNNGFWGMIAMGHKLAALSGKDNELTAALRQIEKIVGAIQAVYSGHMSLVMFDECMQLVPFLPDAGFVTNVTNNIGTIMNEWKYLPIGKALELEFVV
jgi:hypothetical protein